MKITKEHLQLLIKEELADLEQEGWGDRSWHYGEPRAPRAKKTMPGLTSSPEKEFANKVRQMFFDLTNPIVGQGEPAPSEERINQIVNLHTKDMQPEKIKAAVEMIEDLEKNRAEDLEKNKTAEVRPELMDAFKATVEKLKSAVLQKTQSFPEVPPKIAESKIKITFGKK